MKVFCLFVSVIFLAACVSSNGKHRYIDGKCVSCLNNPFTGEPINYTKEETIIDKDSVQVAKVKDSKSSSNNKNCHEKIQYKIDIPIEIDLAYLKYKRAFGFKTRNEKLRSRGIDPENGNSLFTLMDSGFRHITVPGVRYLMKDSVDLDTGNKIGWLSLELEKSSNLKTRMFVGYCEGGLDGFDKQYLMVIRNKIETSYR